MIVGECIDQQLDRYQLIRLLGQSGSSEVYLGEHRELHTPVAIKMLHRRFAGSDLELFLTQARILSQLEHPHIVRVRDFGIESGTPYLVMTYAPHGNMRQRYPRGTRLSLYTVVFYVKQVADALQYIHERTLIHRDIKPHNMLLGPDHQVLLSDLALRSRPRVLMPICQGCLILRVRCCTPLLSSYRGNLAGAATSTRLELSSTSGSAVSGLSVAPFTR
jgi:eukaryotic-like serine/threonine-protein kinase